MSFLWKDSTPKIRHETICNDYKDDGLSNVDISYKIVSLQCSWIRRLYNNYFHECKVIPLHLITMSFGSKFKFHFNIFLKKATLKKNFYRSPYRDIFINWKTHFFHPSLSSFAIFMV